MSFSSLRTRLLLAVGTLAIALVCTVALLARHSTHVEFLKYQEDERTLSSLQHAENAVSRLAGRCCATEAMGWALAELARDQVLVVVDQEGQLITASGPAVTTANLRQVRIQQEAGVLRILAAQQDAGVLRNITLRVPASESRTVATTDGRTVRAYVIHIPRLSSPESNSIFLQSIDRRLLMAAVLLGLLALGLTWMIARRITSPIGELNEAAHDLARGNLSRRVAAHGSDEVAALARSFNAMAAQLEHHQRLQRHLMQDTAHEFRTPLTALQCLLETVMDGFAVDTHEAIQQAQEQVRHLTRLLDDLHQIALAETGQLALHISDVSVADMVRSAVRLGGLEHDSRLRLEVDSGLMARADPVRARQVVINLLTNAGRHTPSGGVITVRAFHRAQDILVEVWNTGSSLSEEQLKRVFDRFYRADPARQRMTGGTGLGLTIVKYLAEAHGGSVSAASDTSGVTIGFTLPATLESYESFMKPSVSGTTT